MNKVKVVEKVGVPRTLKNYVISKNTPSSPLSRKTTKESFDKMERNMGLENYKRLMF